MARARITQLQYNEMLEAFREKPGNAAHAARRAGLRDYRTAQRAWHRGWDSPDWASAIKRRLEDETALTRAKALRQDEESRQDDAELREARTKARRDAVEQGTRETQAARAAMSSALTVQAALGQLSAPLIRLGEKLAEQLAQKVTTMTVPEVLELLQLYARVTSAANLATRRAMQIERLRVGDPGDAMGGAAEDPIKESAERAVAALGTEAAIQQAARDLFEGNMTPEALALMESQDFDWTANAA